MLGAFVGAQYKTVVEYAPSQRVSKPSTKKDSREGTIYKGIISNLNFYSITLNFCARIERIMLLVFLYC